jgi:hypothetical protein
VLLHNDVRGTVSERIHDQYFMNLHCKAIITNVITDSGCFNSFNDYEWYMDTEIVPKLSRLEIGTGKKLKLNFIFSLLLT